LHHQRRESNPREVPVRFPRSGGDGGKEAVDAALVGQMDGGGKQRTANTAAADTRSDHQVRHVQCVDHFDGTDLVDLGHEQPDDLSGQIVDRNQQIAVTAFQDVPKPIGDVLVVLLERPAAEDTGTCVDRSDERYQVVHIGKLGRSNPGTDPRHR
jgi:hypothetical protein